ncbi:MAG: GNAT family N-acetyltransferase [Bacteroidota bacterium]
MDWVHVQDGEIIIGSAGFKGPPINNRVEIAYGTFEKFRHKGVGTTICSMLVELALKANPSIEIIAHTLPSNKYSEQVLLKNSFVFMGKEAGESDGNIYLWKYNKNVQEI